MNVEKLASYGDAAAIVGFALLVVYFYRKPQKTTFEKLLYLFAILGLLVDSYLTTYRFSRR